MIRMAIKKDIPLILGLMAEYYAFDQIDFNMSKAQQALDSLFTLPEFGVCWLAFAGDMPVGYVVLTLGFSLEFGGREAFIDELFVREKYRGHGYGKRLIEQGIEGFSGLGVNAIHLEVARDNADAKAFYQKLGFEGRERFSPMSKRLIGH